jgi:hypothetical protein
VETRPLLFSCFPWVFLWIFPCHRRWKGFLCFCIFSLLAGFVHHVFLLCICLIAYGLIAYGFLSACGMQRQEADSRTCPHLSPYLWSLGEFRPLSSL